MLAAHLGRSRLRRSRPRVGRREARRRSAEWLFKSAGGLVDEDARRIGLAGWCLMHGFAMLWLQGNLREAGEGPEAAARNIASVAFGGRRVG